VSFEKNENKKRKKIIKEKKYKCLYANDRLSLTSCDTIFFFSIQSINWDN